MYFMNVGIRAQFDPPMSRRASSQKRPRQHLKAVQVEELPHVRFTVSVYAAR